MAIRKIATILKLMRLRYRVQGKTHLADKYGKVFGSSNESKNLRRSTKDARRVNKVSL